MYGAATYSYLTVESDAICGKLAVNGATTYG